MGGLGGLLGDQKNLEGRTQLKEQIAKDVPWGTLPEPGSSLVTFSSLPRGKQFLLPHTLITRVFCLIIVQKAMEPAGQLCNHKTESHRFKHLQAFDHNDEKLVTP